MKKKMTYIKAWDTVWSGVFMAIAIYSAWIGEWDRGSFFILFTILAQLPPRTMWKE